jgi:hypothetical protein
MTKVIRHLMRVRIELFDNGMLRWKMFIAKINYQKLTSNLERVVNRASGGLKQAMYRWSRTI